MITKIEYTCLFMQAEMQRLKDKLAISERTVKAEAQLKVIFLYKNLTHLCWSFTYLSAFFRIN